MSQENVAVVRRATEALNAGNPRAFLDLYDADILLRVTAESFISPGTVVGAAAVERFFDDFYTTFSRGFRSDIVEAIDAGESVIVLNKSTVEGRLSKAKVESPFVVIFTFRGGRIIRIDMLGSRHEALQAVGLEE